MYIGDDLCMNNIIKLKIEDFDKCNNIWNMQKQKKLADKFYNELLSGNRITYVYLENGEYIGEVSLVFDMNDSDYTILNKRVYLSRLIVKEAFRQKGIGTKLIQHITNIAKELNYEEISVGVDLDNYKALKLYVNNGFKTIILVDKDEQGEYTKLLMNLR